MNLLLKKNNLFKLRLLSYFSECETNNTVTMLTDVLKLDNYKLKKQIDLLNDDLFELFGEEVRILKSADSYQLRTLSGLDSLHLVEVLKIHYLQQATGFHILQALFKKNYYSIEDLASDLHLTTSYIYKQLSRLGKTLNPLGIKLTFSQNYGESNITGTEEALRYFIFSFYWSSYKTNDYPFQRIALDKEKITTDNLAPYLTSPSKWQQLYYYLGYSDYRAIKRERGLELDDEFTTLVSLLQQTTDLSIYAVEQFPAELSTILKDENLFFNFIIRNFLTIETPEEQIKIAKQFIETGLPISTRAQYFIDAILSNWHLELPSDRYYTLIYRLTILLLFIRYIGIAFYDAFNYSEILNSLVFPNYVPKKNHEEIKQFYTEFLKEHPFSSKLNIPPKYYPIIHTWIYFIMDNATSTSLKVIVHFSKDIFTELFIKNKIQKTFNENIIQFVDTTAEADLVISDFNEPTVPSENVFFMGNPFDKRSWHSLFRCIHQRLFDKDFS